MEADTHKCFIPPCRTWPRHESNWKRLHEVTTWISSIFRIIFVDVNQIVTLFWHICNFPSRMEGDTDKCFIPPCRTWPRVQSNGNSSWGNYIYLLDFSYDIRWCKVKLLHFFDTFGIISLRWRVTRTSVLYPRVGHGPGMNRTEKVHEVTTCISSIFRIIFVDVNQIVTLFWHIWIFPSTMEGDTDKCFIPLCRTWPRHESNWKSLWGNYIYLLYFSYDIRWCKVKLLHFFETFAFFLCSGEWHAQVSYTPV